MGRAQDIRLKVIPANIANPFVKEHHYSGKVVNNSCLHFGAFLDGNLHGVMSFGPSMDKSHVIKLVDGTGWNEFIELNRMAFDDYLPKYSESHCLGVAMRMIKKNAPQIKWVISFADGCQCGDGCIYRASNFVLTGIRKNKTIYEMPTGDRISDITLRASFDGAVVKGLCKSLGIPHKYYTISQWKQFGAKPVDGYMLRYIYFIDKSYRDKLTVPEIPFAKIDELGIGMYKGKKK